MIHWIGAFSGNWGNDDRFQTSTKKLHIACGSADSARHHRRRADNYNTSIFICQVEKNAQKRAVFL